ncbi:uncharacterized protein LOC144267063 [Eretmochelys imbricata]
MSPVITVVVVAVARSVFPMSPVISVLAVAAGTALFVVPSPRRLPESGEASSQGTSEGQALLEQEPALLEQTVKAIFAFYAQKIKKTLNEMEREDAASLEKKPDREREKKEELKWKLEWLQKVEPVVINIVLNLSGLGNVLTSQQITFMKGLANLADGRIQRANDEAEVTAVVSEAAKEGDHLLHRKSAELLGRDESKKLKQSLDQMAGSYSSLVQSGFRETEFSKEFSAYADRCGPEIFQPS